MPLPINNVGTSRYILDFERNVKSISFMMLILFTETTFWIKGV